MLQSLKKIILLNIILFSVTIASQEPVSIHISENEGLPDVEIYDVIEDAKGFVWIAADKGLYRYDGKEYVNFTTKNKRGLSVFNLKEDAKGRVWCNNISGQFFYVKNDSLHLFIDIKDRVNHLIPRFIVTKHSLEIVTDKGYYRVGLNNKEITQVKREKDDTEITPVYDVIKYQSSLFYVTTRVYKIDGNRTQLLKINDKKNASRFFTINNDLYVNTVYRNLANPNLKNKIFKYVDGEIIEIELPKELVKRRINFIEQINNDVWISTNKGLLVYAIKNNSFVYKKTLFLKEFVTKVMRDRNNNYWVSTIDNGLFIIPNLEIVKQNLPKELQYITTMVTIGKQLIYGTKRGKLVVKNSVTNELFSFNLLSSREISDLAYSKEKNIILISQDLNSYIWNLNTNVISLFPRVSSSKDLKILKNDVLFSGSKESYVLKNVLTSYNVRKTKITKPKIINAQISKQIINKKPLREKRSYANILTKDGKIFVSYVDGVFVSNTKNETKEVKLNNESIFGIDFTETSDGVVWVSTFKNGVLGIVNDSVVYNYNINNGLSSNQTSILRADKNNLWIVNENSLQFVDRQFNTFKRISIKDELSITKISSMVIEDNVIFIAGNNGIISFDKDKVFKNEALPEVYFTSVKIKDESVDLEPRYQLKYRNNNMDFNFNANGFMSKENIVYYYRLFELETEWKTTTSNNVRYPSIPYGEYVFEVKAIHKNKLTESKVKNIRVKVIAPFWLQWWFYLIIMIIISHLYAVRIKKIKIKQEEQLAKEKLDNKLVLSQLENLRSQMNPHFIFNALNSIQEYIITNDKYSASLYLSDFSKLIRKYLEQSRILEVSLKEEVETLRIYLELEKNRFDNSFEYQIEVDKNVDESKVLIPSLFLQPYIENAIKHGLLHKKGIKKLNVRFVFDKKINKLICEIEDNGIGRVASLEINKNIENYHKSFSTSATNDRIDLLNKDKENKIKSSIFDLYDEKEKSIGTKVILNIPQ
jgi:ligand-binding sensor domain-containing protein